MERNAILISEQDSVATVTEAVQRGDTVRWAAEADACVTALEEIPQYHKIAVRPAAAGETVLKYGEYIGKAKCDIAAGAWVHTHNLA